MRIDLNVFSSGNLLSLILCGGTYLCRYLLFLLITLGLMQLSKMENWSVVFGVHSIYQINLIAGFLSSGCPPGAQFCGPDYSWVEG